MECTLDPKLLPVLDPAMLNVKPRNEEPEAEHLLHVYATDRQGWRSFVVPNVTKIYKKVENQ
jgi:murein endopeptidase